MDWSTWHSGLGRGCSRNLYESTTAIFHVKILGTKSPQRYAVRRAVVAARDELLRENPGLELNTMEVKDLLEIQRYTQVFIYPSLVINEKLVCVGRFPKKDEILGWFHEAIHLETSK